MEKVSVIIPTYKRSKFLKRALQSVFQQTYKNIEIIVIDDNRVGSDYRLETEAVMKEYEKNTNIFYLKNPENIGGALSRNKGIEFATGEFIAFLDDDDEYLSDKIEKQHNFYKEKFGNDSGIVFCQSKFVNEKGVRIYDSKVNISGNKEALFQILKTGFTSTGCIFLPKKLILDVNGFESATRFIMKSYDMLKVA
ncbi:MAG: glycosyltransferase family 2 protein [Fusobacteriaceae bacterium]